MLAYTLTRTISAIRVRMLQTKAWGPTSFIIHPLGDLAVVFGASKREQPGGLARATIVQI